MRMKLFGKLFRGRDAPSNSTAGSGYGFFMGSTASGKRVNARSAMQMTAVYSCVRILSEAVAGLPLQFYRYNDNGGKEKAVDHQLYFLLHDEPNPEMTSFVFRETLMTHLLLWGNAYSQIIRNGKGEIVALYPLMLDRMTVDRDEHGRLYYEYLVYDGDDVDGRTGTDPKANGKIVRLHPADVLHIPGLGFDGLVGYSPIAMAKNAIGLAIAAEEYGSKFYANGAAPSGVLEHPGTLKDPGRVRESWQSTFGGSSNANKVAVLEEGMKYTPISIAPNEAQFLETRKFQIDEIARICGYATARQNGWMSANDIRELENMDRIPEELGGDLYLINGNMTKLEDAGLFGGAGSGGNGKENGTGEEVLELEENENGESGNRPRSGGADPVYEWGYR